VLVNKVNILQEIKSVLLKKINFDQMQGKGKTSFYNSFLFQLPSDLRISNLNYIKSGK